MSRIVRSAIVFLLALTCCGALAGPKNIVLIMADDIGLECFGCYGSQQYQTPRIDRLAATGVRFNNCFSQPLCTPSRVKIMTGISNARNYIGFGYMDPKLDTIGHMMQRAGRRTLCVGKWQLHGFNSAPGVRDLTPGLLPAGAGFDDHCLWQVAKRPLRFWDAGLETPRGDIEVGPDGYGPDKCVDVICDFVDANADRPFFVYYPMILVHNPFLPTPDSPDRDEADKQVNFEAMVAYMDKLVGRIVDKLAEHGLRDDTLVLFTGDNGTNRAIHSRLGDRVIRGGKSLPTDAGTRVPLVANWPGSIPEGAVSDALIDFSDFVPTLTELAGPSAAPRVAPDGVSFAPQLLGAPGSAREWVYCYYWPRPTRKNSRPMHWVRDARWRLDGDGAFYDTVTDPLETNALDVGSLAGTAREAHSKLAAALRTLPSEGARVFRSEND